MSHQEVNIMNRFLRFLIHSLAISVILFSFFSLYAVSFPEPVLTPFHSFVVNVLDFEVMAILLCFIAYIVWDGIKDLPPVEGPG